MPVKAVTLDCPVEFSDKATPFGEYANSVRVTPEGGDECYLDFCVYSSPENQAQIVTRVRVHRSFLDVLHDRIGDELALESVRTSQERSDTPDERIVFLNSPKSLN